MEDLRVRGARREPRLLRRALLGTALAALATACDRDERAARPGAGVGRPIEMLVSTDVETLDPRHASDAMALRASRLVHAGLVRLDPDTLAPVPYAARGWSWLDDRTLRVELRDVRFHSGKLLAPEDVVATLAAFASPAVGSRHASVVEAIDDARADGSDAVVIHLRRAHATLLTDLEVPILRADEAASPPRPDGSLDGLGPFSVAARSPGAITLAPAEGGPIPKPARAVTLRTVHDENARALRMHAGRADLVVNGISPTLLPALEEAPGVSVSSRPGANLTYLLARGDRGALADERVRRAIATAIDRATLAQSLLAGKATPAATLLPPGHWAYAPEPAWPFAPEQARRLLEEAGARGLTLTLLTSTDRLRGTIARTIAQELADVGIHLDVVPLELGTLLARLYAGDFELATLQMPEITEPNVLRLFLHSASIPPAGVNRGRLRDPEVDRLLDAGDATLEPEARRAIYAKLEEAVRARALFIPLFHEDQVAVTSARAAGFRPSAEGRWLGLASLP